MRNFRILCEQDDNAESCAAYAHDLRAAKAIAKNKALRTPGLSFSIDERTSNGWKRVGREFATSYTDDIPRPIVARVREASTAPLVPWWVLLTVGVVLILSILSAAVGAS